MDSIKSNRTSGPSAKEKVRNVKKSVIEVAGVPMMENLPGSLDPVAYAQARTSEVMLLKKEINDGEFRGSRRVFQTLPRHMRRRAASFNIKRLPTRLREKALAELAKDPAAAPKMIKKPPCRRRRRRTSSITKEFAKRQEKKTWLSTHLWHSKRAHMEDLWGYRIAVKANEKCRKSCIRASRHGCLIYDRSYYEVVLLEAPDWERLARFIPAEDLGRLQVFCKESNVSGYKLGASLFRDQDGQIVGPVEMVMRPNTMALLVHPCITSSITSCFSQSGIQFALNRGEWAIFDFQGAQTIELIQRIVKPCAIDLAQAVEAHETWAIDPRLQAPPDQGVCSNQQCSPGTFWDLDFQKRNGEGRKSRHQLDQLCAQQAVPGTKLIATQADPLMPLLFLKQSGHSNRISLIVHGQWGLIVWRAFLFAGARFAGLEELSVVNLESLRPTFPRDYPIAKDAFKSYLDIYASRWEDKWNRTPPAKRINYEKIGLASPFRLDLSLLATSPESHPRIVRIEMDGKGVPEHNARVYHNGRLIGLVTSGGYSQVYGKGIGFATCIIPDSFDDKAKVQVQNINCLITRPAVLLLDLT